MSHLQFSKHISADFLSQVEQELVWILSQRNMSLQNRVEKSRFYTLLFLFGMLACGVGLLLSLFALAMSFDQPKQMALFVLFALAFGLGLVFFSDKKWFFGRLATFRVRLSTRVSKWMAHRMLVTAKKMAPFVAEYDVRGASAVYYRTRDDITKFVWAKNIHGHSMKGSGFSLFFKNETTVYPHLLVLHDASADWDAHLDELDIKPMLNSSYEQ